MKNTIRCLMALLVVVVGSGCSGSSPVAATVNGKPILLSDLDKAAGGRVGQQIYEMRSNALDSIIENKVLEQEASAKGVTSEELIKQEVNAKVGNPSDDEVKALYEANKEHFKEPLEKLKESIADSIKRNRQEMARRQYLASLREKAKVEVKLEEPPVVRVQVSADDDPAKGPEQAKVTVIEFSDFQCPFCKRARPTVQQLMDTYKDSVKYVFRDFPLSFHQYSFKAHEAANCANAQGKFWEMYQKLFDSQSALEVKNLKGYAKELGLDTAAFDQCLDSGKFAAEVQKDIEDGVNAGVNGTPAFFINGIQVSGAQPFANFKTIIDKELKK